MGLKPSIRSLTMVDCVIIGSLLCAININTFTNAGGLFPGGSAELMVFVQRCAEKYVNLQIPYSAVSFALDAIPAYIDYKTIGEKFTLHSCVMIVLTGMFAEIPPITNITEDILLITIFGEVLRGVALGIVLRGNASNDGANFIVMWISRRTNQPAWNYILAMSAIMLVAAGYLFGWNAALYSVIFQFCSIQVVNFVHTRYKRMMLFIVTSNPDIVIEEIQNSTHHGITRLGGVGTYYGRPKTIPYIVVDSQNVKELVTRAREIDQTNFINVIKTESVRGKFYQRPTE